MGSITTTTPRGKKVGTLTYAAGTWTSAHTESKQTLTAGRVSPSGKHVLHITNAVAQAATYIVYNYDGTTYHELTRFNVPSGEDDSILIEGWMTTGQGTIGIDPAATDTHAVTIEVYEL